MLWPVEGKFPRMPLQKANSDQDGIRRGFSPCFRY